MSATEVRAIQVGSITIGGNAPLCLIAGPCVIESETHACQMADALCRLTQNLGIPYVFKASFDKANRSSVGNPRGPGMDEGLRILQRIRTEYNVPVLTDIHDAAQAGAVADVVDILQIPAFLSRQTDLLLAAGATGKPVNIKKGQFLAPWDMKNAIAKVEHSGNSQVCLTERGVSFGYNNLVVDMRALPMMRDLGVPVIFDATHSVQLPGGQGHASGGDRRMAHVLARAAVAAGIDGLFLEVHDAPESALCDGPNMIALDTLPELLQTLLALDACIRPQM